MSVLSSELEQILSRSVAAARASHHAVLTLEHVVHEIACHARGAALLTACGANVDRLCEELGRHLDRLPKSGRVGGDLVQSEALSAAIQHVAPYAANDGTRQITVEDLLAALLLEKTAHVVGVLARQRVTRLSVTTYLAHGSRERSAATILPRARVLGRWWARGGRHAEDHDVIIHNDPYTKAEFVSEILVSLFGRSLEQAVALIDEIQVHGAGSVGPYSLPEAKRLIKRATAAAQQAEFPLRMSIAPHPS